MKVTLFNVLYMTYGVMLTSMSSRLLTDVLRSSQGIHNKIRTGSIAIAGGTIGVWMMMRVINEKQ